jgi:hypothetical protein
MGKLWRFVWAKLGPWVTGGVVITGYILDALEVFRLGLPIAVWQAVGAFLFVVIIGVLVSEKKKQPTADLPPGASVLVEGPNGYAQSHEIVPKDSQTTEASFQERLDSLRREIQEKDRQISEIVQDRQEHAAIFQEYKKVAGRGEKVLKDKITEKDRTIDRLQIETAEWRQQYNQLDEIRRYGEPLATFPPLGEADYSVMVSRVGELRSRMDGLRDAAYGAWRELTGWSSLRDDYRSPSYWQAKLLTARVWEPFDNCVRALNELLENHPHDDPRPYLLLVCKKHARVHLWIEHLRETQKVADDGPVYMNWQAAKERCEASLAEKLGAPQLRDVKLALDEHYKLLKATPVDELL